ncbi:hypothetical protein [Zoogloea sp.]|uniref:hypothetical protein n=1 Tax=Zoogloea sp. TaxID=49181 RepID=UPI0035B15759
MDLNCTPNFEMSFSRDWQARAEGFLEKIKSASANRSRSFDIVVQANATVSLFSVNTLDYLSSQEDSIPRVSYVAHDSTFYWVDKVVEFSRRSMEDAALKEIAEITTKLKLSHGESQISAGLCQLSRRELPDIVAIALLRNTFSFRSKVSCWGDFLAATEKALSAKGKDSKKLLRGLKK